MASETLRPNAAGDETNIPDCVPNTGEAHWEDVDDVTPDDTTTRVRDNRGSPTTYLRDLYNLPSHSGSGTINSVKIYFRCGYNGGEHAKPSLKTHSTVYDGTEVTISTGVWTTYSQAYTTNPYTGSAWTWDEIDALQIGVSLKAASGFVSCTQVYVEVDYTAVTAKTSSDTGTGTDAVVSLQTPQAKSSSDSGAGAEGTPTQSAILVSSETGSGIEALIARLLTDDESGNGSEVSSLDTEEPPKDLFASEAAEGADRLVAKIEIPVKGGGMKLWT